MSDVSKLKYDLTGKRYGKLIALEYNNSKWLCKCDCGNEKQVGSGHLRDGLVSSCGCFKRNQDKRKVNKFIIDEKQGTVQGFDDKGKSFIFDLEDYEKVKNLWWKVDKHGYPVTRLWENKKDIRIPLHRFVLNVDNKTLIDHIDRDSNNNRKNNLRIVTYSQNSMNQSLGKIIHLE